MIPTIISKEAVLLGKVEMLKREVAALKRDADKYRAIEDAQAYESERKNYK